jgi:hypothetical protein
VRRLLIFDAISSADYASPAADLVALLEKFSYERQAEARPGWVALAIHDAGVPFEAIFAVYDELFTAKVRRVGCAWQLFPLTVFTRL